MLNIFIFWDIIPIYGFGLWLWQGYKRVAPKKVHWGQFRSHHYRELRVMLRRPPVLLLPNASSFTLDLIPPLIFLLFAPTLDELTILGGGFCELVYKKAVYISLYGAAVVLASPLLETIHGQTNPIPSIYNIIQILFETI